MEKQRNRGQDGAGIANIKLNTLPGQRFISRSRSIAADPLQDIFGRINQKFTMTSFSQDMDTRKFQSQHAFTGELFLGHLRYGTFGGNSIEGCHPFLRQSNWKTRNLILAGNFNLTNVPELFKTLVDLGQSPKEQSDTVTMLENMGHFLDQENQRLFTQFKSQGHDNTEISNLVAKHIDVQAILTKSAEKWDGGYVMTGLLGHGDAFVLRDPHGIRPAYCYENDEVAVAASERPPIQNVFNAPLKDIQELRPGHAWIIQKSGVTSMKQFKKPRTKRSCSFERIYFSRGNDKDIYLERKQLGKTLLPEVLNAIDHDLAHTVFSFIPNTAETAFLGLMEALHVYMHQQRDHPHLKNWPKFPRMEKLAIKDAKFRTFISQDAARDEIVAHVYDVTYGLIKSGVDQLVLMDDSIVRGTTLKKSILCMLNKLKPKKIIIASSAPQIRYPDCYGIDMAKIGDFAAFQAVMALLKERKKEALIQEVYQLAKVHMKKTDGDIKNCVKLLYAPFEATEISQKISDMLIPEGMSCPVEIIYQSLEGLSHALPNHKGDWYFTGDYPTEGGKKIVNQAFVRFIEGNLERAYA